MPSLVYNRPERRKRTCITADLEAKILEALQTASQQKVARQLGLSQTAVGKVARRQLEGGVE